MNEDRRVASVAKMSPSDSSFWQCKVYAVFWGFPGDGASKNSGVIENVDFQCFQTLSFQNLRK